MAKLKDTEEVSIENETSNEVVTETVNTVEAIAARDFNRKESERKSLYNVYKAEGKVPVTISPFYAPYLGRVVRQDVNGFIVDIPANGQTYMVNETHAIEIITRIKRIDAMLARQKRAGDISNNFESAPGELHI